MMSFFMQGRLAMFGIDARNCKVIKQLRCDWARSGPCEGQVPAQVRTCLKKTLRKSVLHLEG